MSQVAARQPHQRGGFRACEQRRGNKGAVLGPVAGGEKDGIRAVCVAPPLPLQPSCRTLPLPLSPGCIFGGPTSPPFGWLLPLPSMPAADHHAPHRAQPAAMPRPSRTHMRTCGVTCGLSNEAAGVWAPLTAWPCCVRRRGVQGEGHTPLDQKERGRLLRHQRQELRRQHKVAGSHQAPLQTRCTCLQPAAIRVSCPRPSTHAHPCGCSCPTPCLK